MNHYAILIHGQSDQQQADALSVRLAGLGFRQCADMAAVPALSRVLFVHWMTAEESARIDLDALTLPADSIRFAVVPTDMPASVRVALAAQFDGVLNAPVDDIALCQALAAQHYDGIAPCELQSLRAKVLALACDDVSTASHLLNLIADTNLATVLLLCDSVEASRWTAAGSAAHRIAGSARMLECNGLIALLTRFEAAARDREVALASVLLPLVVNAIDRLGESIRQVLSSVDRY